MLTFSASSDDLVISPNLRLSLRGFGLLGVLFGDWAGAGEDERGVDAAEDCWLFWVPIRGNCQ